jgi:hypothetical protein
MPRSRVIGEWISHDELANSRGTIPVGPDEAGIVIADGVYGEPQIETRLETGGRFSSVWRSKHVEVLIANLTDFTVNYVLDDLTGKDADPGSIKFPMEVLSSDDELITGQIQLTLAVSRERPGLLRQLRQGRTQITDLDIGEALAKIFLSQVVATNIAVTNSSDVRPTAGQFSRLLQTTETQLKSQLETYGLELRNFAPNLFSDEARTRARKKKLDDQKQIAEAERDLDQIASRATGQRSSTATIATPSEPRAPEEKLQMLPPTRGGGSKGWLVILGIIAVIVVVALSSLGR